jgi:hypothetical protein
VGLLLRIGKRAAKDFHPQGFFEANRSGRATICFDFQHVHGGTYDFVFGYNGSGVNHCDYIRSAAPPRWNCSDHY